MLVPAKTKFRKVHKGRNRGPSKGNTELSFGDFGIQALERGSIPASQIEA
ncbi:MAG: ribosomal protein L16, partial [Puniceicoccales bacterium]|nr:ribosomal protein L16 [Puniceicoccales bacterium]